MLLSLPVLIHHSGEMPFIHASFLTHFSPTIHLSTIFPSPFPFVKHTFLTLLPPTIHFSKFSPTSLFSTLFSFTSHLPTSSPTEPSSLSIVTPRIHHTQLTLSPLSYNTSHAFSHPFILNIKNNKQSPDRKRHS